MHRNRAITAIAFAAAFLWVVPTVGAADVTNPAQVEDLIVTVNAGNSADLDLNWGAVTTDVAGNAESVSEYRIYRGDTPDFVPDKSGGTNLVGTTATTTYTDVGALVDDIERYYAIGAVDADGNESSTRVPEVMTAPVLSGSWTDTSIDLNWTDAEPVANVVSYKVYYGKAPGDYEFVDDVGLSTSYSLSGLELWVNWYFAVTAVDPAGNESAFSNEHSDAIAGRVRVQAHDEEELCWGAEKCTPTGSQVQRSNGWQIMVPTQFHDGDWTRVLVRFTMDSKLCEPPANQNITRCGSGNPCLNPPCNGGYNTCGDPWDRTAHLFLVLDDCINAGGDCRTNNNLELIRAVTPFGTDAPAPDGRGIVPPRELEFDITPYASLFSGEMHVGAHIGHFVQSGWYVSTEFEFSKRPDEASPKPPADGIQVLFWNNQSPPTATLSVPATATDVYTRLFTTGHGGNQRCDGGSADGEDCSTGCPGGSCQNCDEFCHRTNEILSDGSPIWSEIPWRTDCSPGIFACQDWNSCGFPSCTFSRAGWCPGYIACHHDAPCDNDLNFTTEFAPGGTYAVDYQVFPVNGSWDVSLVAYWYE